MSIRYDLFSPEFKTNPFPTLARMRTESPIYAHQTPKGETIWYISRYKEAITVLKESERFVKDQQNIKSSEGLRQASNSVMNQNMLFADPPEHTRLRTLAGQVFTPQRIKAMAPKIQAIADRLLDLVQAHHNMDLIAAYARPLPIIVIAEMLGLPAADRDEICDLSQAIISPGRQKLTFSARRRKVNRFTTYLQRLITQRQQAPGPDLITGFLQAEIAGETLSPEALLRMVSLLLVTGHETTVNLIGNGVLALLQAPDQLAWLKTNPDKTETAVEELLRYDGPVETSTTRWAAEDMVWQDHQIRAGDTVRAILISANRDPVYFDRPDQLDLSRYDCRNNGHHLAFGHGIHYCLGAPLARLEGQIAFETLFRRLPNLRLALPADKLHWQSGVLFRGLTHLPVQWI